MARWLAALFLFLLLPGAAAARDSLTIALPLEPPNLDPTSGAAVAIDEVTYHSIYEGLVTLTADGTVKPLLATAWTVSADARTYMFTLRPGVRFHDGEIFDAAAVVFSLRRAIAPDSSNAQRDALSNIAEVVALGPLSVRVTLKEPDSGFLTLLSYGDAAMLPPRAAAAAATHPVGTGPFRFGGWRRGDTLTLVRNPGYWGRPAHLGTIVFRFIVDPSAAFAAVKAHDVDLFYNYPAPETLAELKRDPTLAVTVGPSQGEVILALNNRAGPLADLRVRRAIAHAIDRGAIIDGAMYGYGTPIGSHFPPQSPDYVDLTGLSRHDVALARRLMAEAGYADGFALTLKLPPPPYARRSGEIIASQLGRIGIRVALRNLEWSQWLDEVLKRHAFDMTIVNHAEPFDYDIYGRPDYYFGYRSPELNGLLADLRHTADPLLRRSLLAMIQRRIAGDAVNGFLFQYPTLAVGDRSLTGLWVFTPNIDYDLAAARFADGSGGGAAGPGAASGGRGVALAAAGAGAAALLGFGFLELGLLGLVRRLGILLLTFLAATIVVFLLVQVAPGDPAAFMMGMEASPQAVAALHAQLGLDGPAPARYLSWLGGMVRGDFGTSYTYRVPVGGLVAERLAVSVPLALFATLLSILVGVPAGYVAASREGRTADRLIGLAARIGIAVPGFWLGILLILLFSVMLRLVGAGGFPGWEAGVGPALGALLLPTVALGVPQAAILARVTRAALLETMGEDHVRTARAKGLSRGAALRRHALPLALGPVVTVLGLQIPFLVAGSAIVENVFFLPGLGRLLLQAISQRDLIVVQSAVAIIVLATILTSFAVDLVHRALDPRLRGRG